MRVAPFLMILLMLALLWPDAQAGSNKRQQKDKKIRRKGNAVAAKARIAQRNLIVKCCGRASCSKMAPKKKHLNKNRNFYTKTIVGSGATYRSKDTLQNDANSTLGGNDAESNTESPPEGQSSGPDEEQTQFADDTSTSLSTVEKSTLLSSDETSNTNTDASEMVVVISPETTSADTGAFASTSHNQAIAHSISESQENSSDSTPGSSSTKASSANAALSTVQNVTTVAKATAISANSSENPTEKLTSPAERPTSGAILTSSILQSSAKETNNNLLSTSTSTPTSTSTTSTSTTSTSTTTTSTSTTTSTTKKTSTVATKGYTTATTKVPMVLPSCPLACTKDTSLFKSDGALDDPSSHGFWETGCGELYVFGKSLANWEQNMEKCCSIGMTPLTIDSKEKSACFNKLIDGVKWKYNSRYWSSGLRSSETDFKWCNSSATVDPALWLKNEPNNYNASENCAEIAISKTNSSALLSDKHCGRINAFACQGRTTPKPPCEAPTCPNDTSCQKDKNFYTLLRDGKTSYLTNPSRHGHVVPFDNRTFVFSFENDTRTVNYEIYLQNAFIIITNNKKFQEAYYACCAIGMKLLSLHQAHKYKSTMDALKSANLIASEFWTSGTDLGCEGSHGYCASSRLLREEAKWDISQPDNLNGNEHCLSIGLTYNSALLRDENCESKKRYICEARQASGAKIVELECGSAFNVTAEEIKALMESMPTTLQEKCFLKCFGEGTDMFINGRLVEDKIFAQFTSVSAGDMGKLMEMYSTMNFCGSSTRGMNACDKMSQLLKCGKANSPDLLNGVLTNLENTIKEPPLILPPTAGVCPDFTCVIDDALKLKFDTAPHHTYISDATFNGYTTYVCNKKYLFSSVVTPLTLDQGMEFCCKFGLRLLTVTTQTQLQCLTQNYPMGSMGANTNFMVAASRLGFLSNPKWCFSDAPFYPTVAADGVVTNTDPLQFLVVHAFNITGAAIYSKASPYNFVACEDIK